MEKETSKKASTHWGRWFRNFRPLFSFLRELSVVILGIAITFGINAWHNNRSRQEMLRLTMQTVVTELEKNRDIIREHQSNLATEQRIFGVLSEHGLHHIPVDTLAKYQYMPGSFEHIFLSHYGLSMLQSSSLISTVKETVLTAELFRCYDWLTRLQDEINGYADWKVEAIRGFLSRDIPRLGNPTIHEQWEVFLGHVPLHNFIVYSSPLYLAGVLDTCLETQALLDDIIARIKLEYDL